MQVAQGIIVGGKYEVEQPLARGGMGAVWAARHVKLGSPVAIKFLDAHLADNPALVARFEREARSAANLDTPHVVRVHDYGVEDGTPYLVMELLRGEDLNTRLRKKKRFSLAETANILSQIGRALRRAHEIGLIHRDLKPANVFIARVEDTDVVKILDFGIAKETWSRVDDTTKSGEIFGSPHYMSPEHARAQKNIDHRTDVWAAGAIAYRMVTGRLPFPGEVLGEILSSVLVDPVPPMAEAAPDLPAALDGFFEKALAKKRDERFSSIVELVDAFALIAGETPAGRASLPSIGPSLTVATFAVAPDASATVDTDVPTRVLPRPGAPAERISLPSVEGLTTSGNTAPSMGTAMSAVSAVVAAAAPRRKTPVVWIAGAMGLGAIAALALMVINRGSGSGAASAGSSASTVQWPPDDVDEPLAFTAMPSSVPATTSLPGVTPAVTLSPTTEPSASATASQTTSLTDAPPAIGAGTATAKSGTPTKSATGQPTSSPKGAPAVKWPAKKPDPDWGL